MVVAPLALVGMKIAAAVMRFPMAVSSYTKAGGAAAAWLVISAAAVVLDSGVLNTGKIGIEPSSLTGIVDLVAVVGGIAAAFFTLRHAFWLNWLDSAVAFGIAGVLGAIGIAVQQSVADAVSPKVVTLFHLTANNGAKAEARDDAAPKNGLGIRTLLATV